MGGVCCGERCCRGGRRVIERDDDDWGVGSICCDHDDDKMR